MRVDKLAVGKVFDATERAEAPLFQRPYVWEEEKNWQPLWDSLSEVAERLLLTHNDGLQTRNFGEHGSPLGLIRRSNGRRFE